MSALSYKQLRQIRNAVRESFRSPGQLLAMLFVLAYIALSLGMIVSLIIAPIPPEVRDLFDRLVGAGDPAARLETLRGGLVLTLLLLASTAAFQNPLLQFAQADIDLLFAAPVPVGRVLLTRILLNHARTLFAGYFFWGLAAAPALRLLGLEPWPAGALALVGLPLLFATVDQAFALGQIALLRLDLARPGEARPASLWLVRAALVILGVGVALVAAGLLARLITGSWALMAALLGLISGPLSRTILLPLGLAGDLLLLPAGGSPLVAGLALAGLLAADALSAWLLLRYVRRGGTSLLLETAINPQTAPVAELTREVGLNPLRLVAAIWRGEVQPEAPGDDPRAGRPLGRFSGPAAHLWRRQVELGRSPLRSGLSVAAMGLIPLAIYDPGEGYSLPRLLTAVIFSSSLATQLFNDVADHLRYANLELSLPMRRWQVVVGAMAPRLALYWLGGLVLLIGAGLLSAGARWGEIAILALWYPIGLVPLLSLRAGLVFIFPAAGIPGQKDPIQAVLVLIINGLLVLLVISLLIAPFVVATSLISLLSLPARLIWPGVFLTTGAIGMACFGLMLWAYRRFEPREM